MNTINSTGVLIKKRDYFKLPDTMRQMTDVPMVLSSLAGKQAFVRAIIVD
jgi:hypothetical protein